MYISNKHETALVYISHIHASLKMYIAYIRAGRSPARFRAMAGAIQPATGTKHQYLQNNGTNNIKKRITLQLHYQCFYLLVRCIPTSMAHLPW